MANSITVLYKDELRKVNYVYAFNCIETHKNYHEYVYLQHFCIEGIRGTTRRTFFLLKERTSKDLCLTGNYVIQPEQQMGNSFTSFVRCFVVFQKFVNFETLYEILFEFFLKNNVLLNQSCYEFAKILYGRQVIAMPEPEVF